MYALEVNRGWFKEHDVNVGDQVFKPLNEDVEIHDAKGNLYATVIDLIKPEPIKVPKSNVQWIELGETTNLPRKTGNILTVYLGWRGKSYNIQMFFSSVKVPSRREVQDQLQKGYPGSKLWSYQVSSYDPGEPLVQTGGR